MDPLPIDATLPAIVAAVTERQRVVVEAPPGAGKTTRLPMALAASLGGEGQLLVSEPRRLAARLAAHRVTAERGLRLGEEVGYTVRFEDVTQARTRVRYVTDGILLRRMVQDPGLTGVQAVVLDEIHERHLATDVTLALLVRCLATARPDLVVVAMSATLEAAPIAVLLGDCPRVTSAGRVHPVEIRHLGQPDARPLPLQIVSAVKTAVREGPPGDVLVFVPGAGEIRGAMEALSPLAAEQDLELRALHGDLSVEDQARAVTRGQRRKVVVSTNVAESSVTIEGVTTVIDSGLARVSVHSPWNGVASLVTRPASRASLAQRAGRAGRTAPGLVLRLFTRGDHETRPAHDTPEIARSDLSAVLLLLLGAGVERCQDLRWLEPPPSAAVSAAEELLSRLGARDGAGRLTPTGRRMLDLADEPRIARVLVEAECLGVSADAARLAAVLGERDPRLATRARLGRDAGPARVDGRGDSDPIAIADQVSAVARANPARLHREGLDGNAVAAIERARRQYARALRDRAAPPQDRDGVETALRRAILTGFPDRVARRRRPGERALVLASGDQARLGESSLVHDAPFLVAIDADVGAGRGGVVVRRASAIDPDWLLDLPGDLLTAQESLLWNAEGERVERVERLAYGSVTLDESRGRAPPSAAAAAVLAQAARAANWESESLAVLLARLELLARYAPALGAGPIDAPALDALLVTACDGATSFAELAERRLTTRLLQQLPAPVRSALDDLLPLELSLPSGRRLAIHYARERPPHVASRLQDFFGLATTPSLCAGRLPVTVHLLAPNQRAVQVTTDLAGFWSRHYPGIRRELMRRYPKHAWPEEGATARPPAAPAPGTRRRG